MFVNPGGFVGAKFSSAWLVLFFAFATAAQTLPKDHFLYPADAEIDFLLGNTNSVSLGFAKKLLVKCNSGTADVRYADLCRAADWIRKSSSPADDLPWSKLNAQVLYFGEMHFGQESKHFLAAHMNDLKAQGIGAIGMEMFSSIHQDVLDRYFQDQATLDEVKAVLVREWSYESSGYLSVIATAKAAGLRILALDDHSLEWKDDFFKSIHLRDDHMAKVIADRIAAEPSLKIAVLCGRMHSFGIFSREKLTLSQPAILREQYHLTTQSLLVFSDLEVSASGFSTMQKAVWGEGVSTVTALPADYGYADYMVFLREAPAPAP